MKWTPEQITALVFVVGLFAILVACILRVGTC